MLLLLLVFFVYQTVDGAEEQFAEEVVGEVEFRFAPYGVDHLREGIRVSVGGNSQGLWVTYVTTQVFFALQAVVKKFKEFFGVFVLTDLAELDADLIWLGVDVVMVKFACVVNYFLSNEIEGRLGRVFGVLLWVVFWVRLAIRKDDQIVAFMVSCIVCFPVLLKIHF